MALGTQIPLTIIRGEQSEYPAAAVDIAEGTILGDNGSGYARELTAGDLFIGHAMLDCENSAGSAGDQKVQRLRGRYRLEVTITGVSITDVGSVVYASARNTYTLSMGSNSRVGLVERYVAANTAIIECQTMEVEDLYMSIANSARGRATTALPTEEIWNNFNLFEMRVNPLAGSLLELDFTHGENEPSEAFADTSSVIRVIPGAAGEGALSLFTTADNEAAEVQFPSCPITSTGGAAWALEARLKVSVLTDAKAGVFIGLLAGDVVLAGDTIVDGGTLADVGAIGFQLKEADGDKFDVVYDKAGQTQNEHDDDYATPVADTYLTLGLYYNGTTIQMYLDGVATGTAMSAVDIAAADFPAADVLVPTIAIKAAHADDYTVTLDWLRVAQLAA
jgi:hypothetical protein